MIYISLKQREMYLNISLFSLRCCGDFFGKIFDMDKSMEKDRSVVYSSGRGSICPDCGNPVSACRCKEKQPSVPKGDGIVRVRRETKGRGGKTITTISGVPMDFNGLEELASKLKRRLGTGGSVKDGVIEIQGDRVETVMTELAREGFTVKRAGG